MTTVAESMRRKLTEALAPTRLVIIDEFAPPRRSRRRAARGRDALPHRDRLGVVRRPLARRAPTPGASGARDRTRRPRPRAQSRDADAGGRCGVRWGSSRGSRRQVAEKRHGGRSGARAFGVSFRAQSRLFFGRASSLVHSTCSTRRCDVSGCRRPGGNIGKAKPGRTCDRDRGNNRPQTQRNRRWPRHHEEHLTVRRPEHPTGRTASIRHSIRSSCCCAALPSAAFRPRA